jgi:tetratricopeptide (TPR) repeat protein
MSFPAQSIPSERPLLRAAKAAIDGGDLSGADTLFLEQLEQTRDDASALAEYGDFCLRTGRHETACFVLYKANALRPGDGARLGQLGYAQLEIPDFATARDSFAAALVLSPDDALAHYGMGLCCQHEGDWLAAVRAFERTLTLQPDTLPILLNLADACHRAGDPAKARMHFERAARLAPRDPAMLLEYGKFLREQGEASQAMRLIDLCAQQHPDEPPVILEKARCLRELGDPTHAMRWLERLNTISPGWPDCAEEFGNCRDSIADFEQRDLDWLTAADRWIRDAQFTRAEPLLRRLLAKSPTNADAWNSLGMFEAGLQRLDAAETAYRTAIQTDPSCLAAHANLADLYERTNRVVEAKAAAEHGLRFIGSNGQQQHESITLNLVACRIARRQNDYSFGLDRLDRVDALDPNELERVFAGFERGKLMDLLGDTSRAIAAFTQANALVGASWPREDPRRNKFLAGVEYMLDLARKGWLRQWKPVGALPTSPKLAFLIGFPRSGTTLLNQVLDTHSAIQTMEEKPPAAKILDAVRSMPNGYPHAVPEFDTLDIAYLREAYFRSALEHGASDPSKLLVDKFPLHITMVDLLHRVFPDARFVFALRHPCDVVLSCFMQNFRLNEAMANFCTLADSVALYARTMDLWQLYREQLPLKIHTVRYEDVVEDFDEQVRALCSFLGIPWEDSLRQFSTKALDRGRINTPSYEQVSKPIYRDARYRWHRYREHLAPYLPVLRPYIERFGYSPDTAQSTTRQNGPSQDTSR